MIIKYIKLKDDPKNLNTMIKISGVQHAPLLLGQVQIGTMYSSQQELLVEELLVRELTFSLKELITYLKKMLVKNEYSDVDDPVLKKHLDNLNEIIAMIVEMCRCREATI